MLSTRVLLGTALTLSVAALAAVLLAPRPVLPKPGVALVTREGGLRVEARTSHTAVLEAGTEAFVELTVTDESEAPGGQAPVSMALVMDTSGSMAGQKMTDAVRAAHRLVDLLGERDELGLVAFGADVQVVERRRMDSSGRAALHQAIDGLVASGATYLSGGVEAGRALLRGASGTRRLVLVSDGRPTVGLTTEPELASLVGQTHDEAITVTALGVGDDYDGMLMQHLAERGGGMYGYLQEARVLDEVLGKEVAAARSAVARNVVLELSGGPHFTVVDAPGRFLEGGRLHLADLQPRTPTRVLVRVHSRVAAAGDVAALRASLSWHDLAAGQQRATQLQLAALVVDDASQVQAGRDEAVYSRGINALGSLRLVAAAAAYERGDTATAGSLLDSARGLFGMSADALAGQAEVEQVRKSFGSAGLHERKSLARGLERKKLSDFGKENEGY